MARGRSARARFGLGLVLACSRLRLCAAEILRGSAKVPADGTAFLAKFCFDAKKDATQVAGILNATIFIAGYDPDVGPFTTHLATFDDQSESYPGNSVAWDHMTCEERRRRARGWHTFRPGHQQRINIMEHARERFWFLSIMDCAGKELDITYEIHMLNPAQGFQQEFSMDHIGVLPLTCFLFSVYACMALLQLRNNAVSHKMWGQGWVSHPMVRMLTSSLLCFALAMLLLLVHYAAFAVGGQGVFAFYLLARLTTALAKFLLMTILLLLAKGRCISYAMTFEDVRWLLKVLLPFLLASVGLELWGENAQSRKYTTGFVYFTDVGLLLIAVDVVLFFAFAGSLYKTHRLEGDYEKRFFYKVLGFSCAMWFLTLPISAFMALLLAPWVRFKVLMAMTHLSHAAACAVIAFMLRPDNSTYMDGMNQEMVSESVTPSLLGSEASGLKLGRQTNGFKLVLSPLQDAQDNIS